MRRLLLILTVVLMGVSGYQVLRMEAAPAAFVDRQVVVSSGDNLWGIAGRYATPEEDVREVIDRIVRVNRLDLTKAIQPGQKLTVPVKNTQLPDKKLALSAKSRNLKK